ncbi:MAG TPA: histidinol phosphate phosphatase [Desulfotomaculum sp.]|nr:histidinol phosphate phosphatase [Desulfotomaculum sp.]
MYYIDYHIHPGYSVDAEDISLFTYCYQSLQLGLKEICFTPHLEVDPARRHLDWFVRVDGCRYPMEHAYWLDKYFLELDQVKQQFKTSPLKIKAGIEVGFEKGYEKEIEKILANYPFDFVLGAVHCLEHRAISSVNECEEYFVSRSLTHVIKEYFTTLELAVKTGLFDCMAHLDLYRRFGVKIFGPQILGAHNGLIEPVLAEMAKRRIGLELNTSGIRRGLTEFHPGRDILLLARESGINIFTIGSDAHQLKDLGDRVPQAAALVSQLKLPVHIFTARHPFEI